MKTLEWNAPVNTATTHAKRQHYIQGSIRMRPPDYDVIERDHCYKARDHGYEIVHSRYSTPAKELV